MPDRWKAEVHTLSTEGLIIVNRVILGQLYDPDCDLERGARLLLEERLRYVRRELELRSEQLRLPFADGA